MSEVDWGSEANEAPKPKSRVPKWAWFCGGGCLLALIVGGVLAFLVVRKAQEAMDPEKQWASLAEFVPFETRPEGETIIGFKVPFQEIHTFALPQSDGSSCTFLIATGTQGAQLREQYFDGEKQVDLGPLTGNMGRYHVEKGELNVQGRECPSIRFTSYERPESGAQEDLTPMHKSTLALDLTKDGSDTVVIFQYDLVGSLAPVDESDVVKFLAPFKIGEKR